MKTTKAIYNSPLLGETYTKIQHKSGLTICICTKELTTTYAFLAAKCGSLDRKARLFDGRVRSFPAGIAHYLEHKLFDNENGEDSFAAFSALGADSNAFTSYTHTAYFFSATQNQKKCLKELLHFVTHPYFTKATVEKERGIIEEEIKMDRDLPWDRAFQNLLTGLYGRHPLSDEICGSAASIATITHRKLYDFYRLFYTPSNMILSVAGPIEVKDVLSVVDRLLPSQPETTIPHRLLPRNSKTVAHERIEETMQVAKPIFYLGFRDAKVSRDPLERLQRDAAASVLNEILFSKSGDFYNTLFEENLLTPAFSGGYSIEDGFAFNSLSGESDAPDEVVARLFAYLEKMKRDGISEEDLERSRRVLYADEVRAYDSTEEIALQMLSFAMDGLDPFLYPQLIRKVSKKEVERLLYELFCKESMSLSIIRPTKERS